MKRFFVVAFLLALASVASAANYKTGSETVSAVTAADTGTSIDFRGYSELSIQTVFATCTGTSNNCSLWVQTSNNNTNWSDILLVIGTANAATVSGLTYFDYIPNQTAETSAIPTGFGRYVRTRLALGGTASVSFAVYFEAKE